MRKSLPGVGIARAFHFVTAGKFRLQIRLEPRDGHADAFEQVGDEALGLANEREGEVFAVNFLVRVFARDALCVLQSFLRFLGHLVRLHD